MGQQDDPKQNEVDELRVVKAYFWKHLSKGIWGLVALSFFGIFTWFAGIWGALIGSGECFVIAKDLANGSGSHSDSLIFVEARNNGCIAMSGSQLILTFTDPNGDARLKEKDASPAPPGVTVVRWLSEGTTINWSHDAGEATSIAIIKTNGAFPIGAKFGAIVRICKPSAGETAELISKKTRLKTDGRSFFAHEVGDSLSWDMSHWGSWVTRVSLCIAAGVTLLLIATGIRTVGNIGGQLEKLTKGVQNASDAITANLSDAAGKILNVTGPDNVGALMNNVIELFQKKAIAGEDKTQDDAAGK